MARGRRSVSRRAAPARRARRTKVETGRFVSDGAHLKDVERPRARRQPVTDDPTIADSAQTTVTRSRRQPVPVEPDDASERPDISKNIDALVKAVKKSHGAESVMRLGDMKYEDVIGVFPTGIPSLDEAIGIGGFPLAKLVQIVGPESVGKSALCKHLIAQAQRHGITPYFIDAEMSADSPERFASLGISTATVAWSDAFFIEDAFAMAQTAIDTLKQRDEPALIFMDSIAALRVKHRLKGGRGMSDADTETDFDDHGGGKPEKAIFLSEHLPSLVQRVRGSKIGIVFVNQLRQKARALPMEDPWYEVGGQALRYWCHLILRLKRGGRIGQGENVSGIITTINVKKNKMSPPWKQSHIAIHFDGRIEQSEPPRFAQ